jgi:hypothetical protein
VAATPLVDVPIHLQNDADNCGEACAQMVIGFLTGHVPASQDVLAQVKTGAFPLWATAPDQLCAMINHHVGNGTAPYVTHTFTVLAAAMNYALAVLQTNVPVVVLIEGDAHWVVLRGTTGGRHTGVVFRDPTPARKEIPEIAATQVDVHSALDECASFDVEFGRPGGEFATCDHWPGIFRIARRAPVANLFVVLGPSIAHTPAVFSCADTGPGGGSSPFTRAALPQAVEAGLEDLGLLSHEFWAALIGNRRQDVVSRSRLIRADANSGVSDYDLCPLVDGAGRARAAAMVSAVSGRLLRARALPERYLQDLFFDAGLSPETSDTVRWFWGLYRETFESPFFPLVASVPEAGPRYYRPLGRTTITRPLTPTI